MANFMLQDIAGSAWATVGFAVLLFWPGYLLGAATNLFGFRRLSLAERAAWSVALSFACVPLGGVLLGESFSVAGMAVVLWVAALLAILWLVFGGWRPRLSRDRATRMLCLAVLCGVVVVVCESIDLQWGGKLYLSVTVVDQAYRVSFIDSVAHTGVPPANPLFYPGHAVALRYYYFWYALCAAGMRVAHVSARAALIASSAWCGIGMVAVLALFCRHFLQIRAGLRRSILMATLLLAVTGADLLPVLVNFLTRQPYAGDPEWWSSDQVSSWLDSILWVPNHTAALICCMVAFLLLWRTQEKGVRGQSITAMVIAGVSAASAFGLSFYVAAGFAMLMLAWSARLVFRERSYGLAARTGIAAMVAVLLDAPFLRELLRDRSGMLNHTAAGPGGLLRFGIRKMIDPDLLTGLPALASLKHVHPMLLDFAARVVLLLPGYAVELGFYGAVLAVAVGMRRRLDGARRTALFLAIAGLVPVSLLRSSAGGNNDFGIRATLLPSFFLLLLGVDLLLHPRSGEERLGKGPRNLLAALLVLGFAGSVFQAASLRFFVPIRASMHAAGFEGLPRASYETRAAYGQANLPADAVLQANPVGGDDFLYLANMLYAGRQMVTSAADDGCGAVYGGDPADCAFVQHAVHALYALPALTAVEVRATCRALGADYLVASRRDGVWADRGGWVWGLPGVVDTGEVRVVECR